MTRKKSTRTEAKRRKIAKLRNMTVERGCKPSEAANAQAIADAMEAGLGSKRTSRDPVLDESRDLGADIAAAAVDIAPFYVNAGSEYGAPMGRGSDSPEDFPRGVPLHIQMIPFMDGDYDPGGAYWGGGEPIYCVWDDEGHECYRRAWSRADAEAHFPDAAGWIKHEAITCPRCGSESVSTDDRLSGMMKCYEFVDEDGCAVPDGGLDYAQCYHEFPARRPKITPKKRHRRLR